MLKVLLIIFILLPIPVFGEEITYDEFYNMTIIEQNEYCSIGNRIDNPESPCYDPPAGASVGFDGITIFPDDNWFTIVTPVILLILLYFLKCEVDFWYHRRQRRFDKDIDREK